MIRFCLFLCSALLASALWAMIVVSSVPDANIGAALCFMGCALLGCLFGWIGGGPWLRTVPEERLLQLPRQRRRDDWKGGAK